jgi:hypothetical protein
MTDGTPAAALGGANGHASVPLGDGRIAWLSVAPDGHNTVVVQDGPAPAGDPVPGPVAPPGQALWPGDGVVERDHLTVFYHRIRSTGRGTLDFEQTGVALARFALPALTLTSVVDLPLPPGISWGGGVLADGPWTYVYGVSPAPGRLRFAHVARVPAGGLAGPWEFWTGDAWSPEAARAGRLISGVDPGGVQKAGDGYVWVTHENNLVFDPQFVAYASASPTGPFTGPAPLFTAPETATGGVTAFDARVHPELARDGTLLVSYRVSSAAGPRFAEADWPPTAARSGRLAAPAAPVVTAHDDTAELTWAPVAGATAYRVHQRNVTGGQTHPARLPATFPTTSATAGLLVPGHTYEFTVTAADADGEGPPSPVVSATPRSTVPVTEAIGGAGLPDAVPGCYIVQLGDGVPESAVARWAGLLAAQYGGRVVSAYPSIHGFAVALAEEQARDLAGHPDVRYVEQDQEITLQGG